MNPSLIEASNKAVLAYVREIKEVTGLSTYKILKQAEISSTLITNIKNGYRRKGSIISLCLVNISVPTVPPFWFQLYQ